MPTATKPKFRSSPFDPSPGFATWSKAIERPVSFKPSMWTLQFMTLAPR